MKNERKFLSSHQLDFFLEKSKKIKSRKFICSYWTKFSEIFWLKKYYSVINDQVFFETFKLFTFYQITNLWLTLFTGWKIWLLMYRKSLILNREGKTVSGNRYLYTKQSIRCKCLSRTSLKCFKSSCLYVIFVRFQSLFSLMYNRQI